MLKSFFELLRPSPRQPKEIVECSGFYQLPERKAVIPKVSYFQRPKPCISDPTSIVKEKLRLFGGFQVKIKRGVSRITLFRFLLAKMCYDKVDGFHLDEWLVLLDLFYSLEILCTKDPSFKTKYANFFEKDSIKEFFMMEVGGCNEFPMRVDQNSDEFAFLTKTLEPLLPSQHSYYGLKGQRNIRSGFQVVFPQETLQYTKAKPKRTIGVGYRDKGQKRDTAKDGSPAWQEVSTHSTELFLREEEEKQGKSRDDPSFLFTEEWDREN